MFSAPAPLPSGLWVRHGRIDPETQDALLKEIHKIVAETTLLQPTMSNGRALRLKLTNAGRWGWWSDRSGYRYVDRHPQTHKPWPPIPLWVKTLAGQLANEALGVERFDPDSMLINCYQGGDSLGLHRDDTEDDRTSPIVSISLGATCVFAFGGLDKKDPRRDFTLRSGDVVVFGGPMRLAYHEVKKVHEYDGVRYNLTLRRAKP